jgi:hypothetical protein
MKELIDRLFSKTPKFFRVIRNIALSLIALAFFVKGVSDNGFEVPKLLKMIVDFYTINEALIVVVLSQLTRIWRDVEGNVVNEKPTTFNKTINPDKGKPNPKTKF